MWSLLIRSASRSRSACRIRALCPGSAASARAITIRGRSTCTYDEQSRLESVTRPDGRSSRVEYNELGLPEKLTRPDGASVRQTFDERGNLLSTTSAAGATTRFGHNEFG
ncbi:hypothetical protein [Streptomyces sp. NPDC007369]|uniref:hypothetical protein n=1 Tax=Streptomyces sp. NPDC007369 TaxID=3154589 RepID=UPI0033CE8923